MADWQKKSVSHFNNMNISEDILLGWDTACEIASGNIYYNTSSAVVATGWGYLYGRDMMDGGYNKRYEFSVIARTTDVSSWYLRPKDIIGVVTDNVSGSFRINNIENTNPAVTFIRLRELD